MEEYEKEVYSYYLDIFPEDERKSLKLIKSSYELTENKHRITIVNYLNADKIYKDLFRKLGE